MSIWTTEIKEIELLHEALKGQFPELNKELGNLIRTDDENVALLYSRRCLEVIVTDLCECELKKSRGTEPLKGIIDKLQKEEKVPYNIIASMHGLNTLSTFGTHPKDFDPEQVKPVLNNLAIITKWYLKYKGIKVESFIRQEEEKSEKKYREVPESEKSVAILPFKNDSKDEENTYFINGLMEEILNNLQKIKDLRVISRTSVEQYRNQTKPIPEIAKELGVNYIVEGSGQKYGNAFRLRTQLIMAAKESHLWGESYQQEINDVKDIFNVQSQIAQAIAKELKAVITPQEKQLIEKIPTKELAAYDAYLLGQSYWRKLTPNDLETAMKYFKLALEKDSDYALAYAGIGFVWGGLAQMGYLSPAEAFPKMGEALMTALKLDSTLDQIHYVFACNKTWGEWDWETGESEFKKTLEINPNHAEARAYYSHFLNIVGRPKEAMEQIDLALKLDPHNPLLKSLYAIDLLLVHRYDDAVTAAHYAVQVDPTNPVGLCALVQGLHLTANYEEALEVLKKRNSIPGFTQVLDQGYGKGGYKGAMSEGAEALLAHSKTTYINPVEIAFVYLLAGNKEEAQKCLEWAFKVRDPNLPYLNFPIWDSLRNDACFQEIAKKMNLPYK